MNAPIRRYRMTIIHRVPDIEKWREVMSRVREIEHPGLIGRWVYNAIDDHNEVMVDLIFDSQEAATSYLPKVPRLQLREELGLADDFYPPVFIGVIDDELSYRVEPL